MRNFATPILKTVVICCLGFAPLSSLASQDSVMNIKRQIQSTNDKALCQSEYRKHPSHFNPQACKRASQVAQNQLINMLSRSTPARRRYYWRPCLNETHMGGVLNLQRLRSCIKYTQHFCTKNPPNGNYKKCVNPIINGGAFGH